MSVVKGLVIPKVLFPSRYVISCHCCLQLYHCFTLLSAVISLFYNSFFMSVSVLLFILTCLLISMQRYFTFPIYFSLTFPSLVYRFPLVSFFFISLPPVLRACDLFSARWTGRSAQVTNTTQHWYGAACSVFCTVWFSCRYRATYRLYSKCMLLQPFSE